MKVLKKQKLWFLMLNISICLSFSCSTIFNQFTTPSKILAENISEKNTESDDKPAEQFNCSFIHVVPFELFAPINDDSDYYLMYIQSALTSFWPSPNTPPPDLA